MIKKNKYITLATIIIAVIIPLASSQAKEIIEHKKVKWEKHKSITNVFHSKFPSKYKYKIFPFQFNNNTTAYSKTIIGSLEDGADKNKGRSSMIRITQTFGNPLTKQEAESILENERKKYEESAKEINGYLTNGISLNQKGYKGKEFYVAYTEDGKKLGIRVKVYTTNYAKVEQILSGPASSLYSYRAKDYFDSLTLFDGRKNEENPIGIGWVEYPSRNNTFTITVPPKNSDYTPKLPQSSSTPYTETMKFTIKDPLRKKNVQYNVYSYKALSKFTGAKAKSILYSNHVSKYVRNANLKRLKAKHKAHKDHKSMETDVTIEPTKRHPNVSTIFFKAIYRDRTLVIQEVLYNHRHTQSRLHETLFSLLKFHPEKYRYIKRKAKKKK